MKNRISPVVLLIMIGLFIVPSFAQKPKSKDDTYKEIAALTATKKPEDSEKAFQLGKDLLTRFGKDKDDKITKIRTFVTAYRSDKFYKSVEAKNTAEAFSLGKEILADEPDNGEILINLAYAGYNARTVKGEKTFNDDSIGYAVKSLQQIDAGNLPKSFVPFKDKDESIAWLNFIIGNLTLDKDLKSASGYLYKSTLFESPIKNNSFPYYVIASYYEGEYEKLSGDLKAKNDKKTMTDAEFKAASDAVDRSIDLMLDAYARACKRGEAEKHPNYPQWKARLAQVYKFRKKTDAGLPEFITYINTTKMPDPAKF